MCLKVLRVGEEELAWSSATSRKKLSWEKALPCILVCFDCDEEHRYPGEMAQWLRRQVS